MPVFNLKKDIVSNIKNSDLAYFTGRKLFVQSLGVDEITVNIRLREKEGVIITPESVYSENMLSYNITKVDRANVININTHFLNEIKDLDIKHDIESILLMMEDLRISNSVLFLSVKITLVLF